jgi:DNA-directed RNA polymerase subunit L
MKGASQVCVSTFGNHIDPIRRDLDRNRWIENGGDPREFDNHHVQRSYSRDESGRPNWFDITVESVGITPASDLVKMACAILKSKIVNFASLPVQREQPNWYRMEMEGETFTIGQLVQELLYLSGLVEFVSRDVGHPLMPKLIIHFNSKVAPETVIERFKTEALALCENVLKSV